MAFRGMCSSDGQCIFFYSRIQIDVENSYPGATEPCDVCANISPNPLAGIAWMAPLPYVGPIMGAVGTPVILGFLPGFVNTTDVALHISTKTAFVDSLVNDPATLDFKLRMSMIGQCCIHRRWRTLSRRDPRIPPSSLRRASRVFQCC